MSALMCDFVRDGRSADGVNNRCLSSGCKTMGFIKKNGVKKGERRGAERSQKSSSLRAPPPCFFLSRFSLRFLRYGSNWSLLVPVVCRTKGKVKSAKSADGIELVKYIKKEVSLDIYRSTIRLDSRNIVRRTYRKEMSRY